MESQTYGEVKAFCILGTAPRLGRQEGPSALDVKSELGVPRAAFPGLLNQGSIRH